MLHTFVLSDLLLVTMLLAVAIMPLGQFALARADKQRLPRLGTRLTGAGAAAG
jgi:hypothetical protein